MCRFLALYLLHGFGEVKGTDVFLKQSPISIAEFIVMGSVIGPVAPDASGIEIVGRVGRVNNARAGREKLRIFSSHVVAIFM